MDVIVQLEQLTHADRPRAGDKACRLAEIARSGLAVPPALCVTTDAYRRFADGHGVRAAIRMELARKPFEDMRWEEIWDAGLRIRSHFLRAAMEPELLDAIARPIEEVFRGLPVVVRSSAPGEDGRRTSFAGLHDSFVNLRGTGEILRHIPMVWASLWSDRALLYRRELQLDVDASAMAIIVQQLVHGDGSGVAFSRHFAEPDQSVVEAVHGLNQGLVDGTVEPDRWVVDRLSGRQIEHRAPTGRRCLVAVPDGTGVVEAAPKRPDLPPLSPAQLDTVVGAARRLEALFGEPQDVEWTLAEGRLLILQSRPVTASRAADADDKRPWYLSLHRSFDSLKELRRTVEDVRLPALDAETTELAAVDVTALSDDQLTAEIDRRIAAHDRWVEIYWREFIPLAHGIRMFGQVYNDAVRPRDPYEFMDLLGDTGLLGVRRNRRLQELAQRVQADPALAARLADAGLDAVDPELGAAVQAFLDEFGTMAYGDAQCFAEQSRLIRLLLQLAARPKAPAGERSPADREALTAAFLERFDAEARGRAAELLELARSSYRLRDDDNLHMGGLKAEVLRATGERQRRATGEAAGADAAIERADPPRSLRDPNLAVETPPKDRDLKPGRGFSLHPRQLVGQPASPGVATGPARVVRGADDLFEVAAGDVLVCDAIDPNMTFVVPLASAVVERRGGMLIHGAIIAREYGLPCVTGVASATSVVRTGDRLTVDGFLGIVTVG